MNTALPLRTNSPPCQIIVKPIYCVLKGCTISAGKREGRAVVSFLLIRDGTWDCGDGRGLLQQDTIEQLHVAHNQLVLAKDFRQAVSVPQKSGEFQLQCGLPHDSVLLSQHPGSKTLSDSMSMHVRHEMRMETR